MYEVDKSYSYESDLSQNAIQAAGSYKTLVAWLIPLNAIGGLVFGALLAGGGDGLAIAAAVVLGLGTLMYFMRVRVFVLDLQPRHAWLMRK